MSDLPAQAEPKTALELFREEVELLKTCGIIELAARNPRVMEYLTDKDAEIEALRTRAESAEALLAEAGKALEPFATYAEKDGFGLNHLGNPLPDEDGVGWVYLNNGNFRRARSTLSKIGDHT